MTIQTYYNDIDPNACAWMRELIEMGEIPDGIVDDRSILDVRPRDLPDTAHFFAGIGGWAYALQGAGWDPGRPVWTASLPCQPFSDAGRKRGTEDERHLWPVFRDLVGECRPSVVFGEQVASKLGRAWLASVQADLETLGYITAAADLCASCMGAPHIRQRLYWCGVDIADGAGREPRRIASESARHGSSAESTSGTRWLPDTARRGLGEQREASRQRSVGHVDSGISGISDSSRLPDTERNGFDRTRASGQGRRGESTNARDGDWTDVIYIPCADGKARPLKPGIEPLVDGVPDGLVRRGHKGVDRTANARPGMLKGYGNAIVPQVAAQFVRTVMEFLDAGARAA